MSDGGLHFPLVDGGLLRFVPPREFPACAAATSGDARDDSISDPKKIIMKLHVNWGHASATQLKRVLVDSDGSMSHFAPHLEAVLGKCDVCRAFDKAPHVPIAGASAVSMFNEKAQVDLLFLGDLVVAHAMDVFSKYSLLRPEQSKNPQALPGAFRWMGVGSGRLRFGRIPVLSVELSCNSKELVPTIGYWDVAMGLGAECIIA